MLKWLHIGAAIMLIVMITSPLSKGTAWADGYPGSVDNGDGTRTMVFRPSGGLNNGTDQGGAGSGKDAYVFTNGDGVQSLINGGSSAIHHTFKSNCNGFLAHSYFQWDVSALPPASDVTSVKLVLYHDILRSYTWPYQISPTTMNVRAVTSPWNEMAVTYNNQPAVASPVLASVSIPTEIWGPVTYVNNPTGTRTAFKGFVTIDITGLYSEWRSGTRPNNGIQYSRLESFCENANASYVYSSDQADVAKRPALEITYRAAVVDTTPPLVSQALTGTAGANGWYVSDVGVSWSVSDGESAVSTSGCGPSAVTADTGGEVFTCTATSEGGTSSQNVTVRRDGSPPSITGSSSPPANGNGWNNSDVTVSFACSDALSGVASCPSPVTVSAEGAGQSVSGTAVDNAGNSSGATVGGINIDRTAPAVAYSGNAGSYSVDQQVDISCSAVDHLSGVASSNCHNVSGPAYAFSVGTNTYSATATDLAGNAGSSTATFTVVVTPAGLSNLTARFVTQNGLLKSLQAKLNAAEAAADRGNSNAKAGALGGFINEVQAQTGKALTAEQATVLIRLAGAL